MQLERWPARASFTRFVSPKAGGGRRVRNLLRQDTVVVDPDQDRVTCPAPRGRSGTVTFYQVAHHSGLFVTYAFGVDGDEGGARFLLRRGQGKATTFVTFSPSTPRRLVVIVQEADVPLCDWLRSETEEAPAPDAPPARADAASGSDGPPPA